jgi:hypothetical protein
VTACWKLPFQLSQPVSHIGLETAAPASQFLVSNISAKKMLNGPCGGGGNKKWRARSRIAVCVFSLAVSVFGYLPCYA